MDEFIDYENISDMNDIVEDIESAEWERKVRYVRGVVKAKIIEKERAAEALLEANENYDKVEEEYNDLIARDIDDFEVPVDFERNTLSSVTVSKYNGRTIIPSGWSAVFNSDGSSWSAIY